MRDCGTVQGLIERSRVHENAGEMAAAYQAATLAIERARAEGIPDRIAEALVQLANLEFRLGHYEQARKVCDQSLALSGPHAPARADAWLICGNVSAETNSPADAEDFYLKAADLSRQIGCTNIRIRSQHNLAMGVYFPRGQFDLALAAARESYELALQAGFQDYLPYPLTTLTWIYQITGKSTLAYQTLEDLERVVLPGSLHDGYAHFLEGLLCLDDDRLDVAQTHFFQARSIAETIGEPGLIVQARLGMCRSSLSQMDAAAAGAWAADALTSAKRAGYGHMEGLAEITAGQAAWQGGDLVTGEMHLRRAIAVLESVQAGFDLARAWLELAGLLLERKSPEASEAWKEASRRILAGGYGFLIERAAGRLYPLVGYFLNSPEEGLRDNSLQILATIERIPSRSLEFLCLGKFEVWKGQQRIPQHSLNQRRAGELLALLVVSPGHCLTADQVIEALWPGQDMAAARRLLHHATSSLRQALEPELPPKLPSRYLEVQEGQVRLVLPAGSQVDFVTFERHCRSGEWEAAMSLYGGGLMPSFLYTDWSAFPRQRIEQWAQTMLLALSTQRLEEGRWQEALELSQRLLAIEPWQEQGVEIAMRALQGLNDVAGALRLYRRLERTLRTELGVEPQATLKTLAHEMVKNRG